DAGHQHNARAWRIGGEWTALLGQVSFVVAAIPGRVRVNAFAEGRTQFGGTIALRVEVDDERLVLGVDQMVWARCSDLTDLAAVGRGGKGDSLGAAVDAKNERRAFREERPAQTRKRAIEHCRGFVLL